MHFTIDNFEDFVSEITFDRGMEYYYTDSVTQFKNVSSGIWQAKVRGSRVYNVTIHLNGRTVEGCSCNCPHDALVCKHIVAALLAIREELEVTHKKETETSKYADAHSRLDQLLSVAHKSELESIIAGLAKDNKDFEKIILSKLNNKFVEEDIRDYVDEVAECFVENFDEYFDSYDWHETAGNIYQVLNQAQNMLNLGNERAAFLIAWNILNQADECFDENNDYEDSGADEIGFFCDKAQEILLTTFNSAAVSDKERHEVLNHLAAVLINSALDNYCYYRYSDLLEEIIDKKLTPEMALAVLDTALSSPRLTNYNKPRFMMKKKKLLVKTGRSQELKDYVSKNIDTPEVRLDQVNMVLAAKDYDQALKLIEEGMRVAERDKDYSVHWKDMKIQALEAKGDSITLIEHLRKLFINSGGEFKYYEKLKRWVNPQEWDPFLAQLIKETKFSYYFDDEYNLRKIYAAEGDAKGLMDCINRLENNWHSRKSCAKLDEICKNMELLKKDHSQQVIDIFRSELRAFAERNTGRDFYAYIAKMLKKMRAFEGGKQASDDLAQEFSNTYPKRRLFIAELKSL